MAKKILLIALLLNIIPFVWHNGYLGAHKAMAADFFDGEGGGGGGEDGGGGGGGAGEGGGGGCDATDYTLSYTYYGDPYMLFDQPGIVYQSLYSVYADECGDTYEDATPVENEELTQEYQDAQSTLDNIVANSSADNTPLGSDIGDITPGITKYKNPHWRCYKGWPAWELDSYESGVVTYYMPSSGLNQWVWSSLTHNSIALNGTSIPAYTTITWTLNNSTPSFTPATASQLNNITSANIVIDFTVYMAVSGANLGVTSVGPPTKIITENGQQSPSWSSDPNVSQ